jgi:outer membrane murein-binding lipoprotein Lpp
MAALENEVRVVRADAAAARADAGDADRDVERLDQSG